MNLSFNSSLIIITGQTATGKTKLALKFAKKYNGEIINCDSRQIYKYLDIITGKDLNNIGIDKFKVINKLDRFDIGFYPISTSFNQLKQTSTKLWLYDIIDPLRYFSSFDWVSCAKIVIDNILKRKKTPIIVGGTYFYIKHLLYGIDTENIPPNWTLRKNLKNEPVSQLQKILISLNKNVFDCLNQSDKNNPRRLIRKIEIEKFKQKNKNYLKNKPIINYKIKLFIGLRFKDKENLKKAIEKRVEERLKKGAINEVKNLLKKGYKENSPGLKTIGYQEIIHYLKGEITKNEAINQWILHETQYAKRQYTFMKKDKNIKWIEI